MLRDGLCGRRGLSGQFLERQSRSRNHMAQRVNEQIGAFPAVKAERHFVQVGWEVLGADLVPRSVSPEF
jgi:hypothetical protein